MSYAALPRSFLGFALLMSACGCSRESGDKPRGSAAKTNRRFVAGEAKFGGSRPIEINPLMDLNLKTRQEIFDLRGGFVRRYPELAADYEPSRVFESIEDGKPWWGFGGYDHYGPGARSSEGLSVQSHYINNPFLLVGLSEHYILWNMLGAGGEDPPRLVPTALEWRSDTAQATAKYDVGSYFAFLSRVNPGLERELRLIAYNARDFGLNYLWVDSSGSKNIDWRSVSPHASQIPQYIHCGGSCGNPSTCCNNMSPAPSKNFTFVVRDLPARARISLWREKPYASDERPDMTFIIEMY